MVRKDNLGLLIIGLSFIGSIILWIISFNICNTINYSFIYLLYPFVFIIFILIVYYLIRIYNTDLELLFALVLSILNLSLNLLQVGLLLR